MWKLHLTIPPNYPTAPPTANFRTPIFHPNVDPSTGGVCVETLKRDWDSKLTLRDVLVTISCLLIQPNPDSALNAEAGSLIQEDYESYARRAKLMTTIHAKVPRAMAEAVKDAQERGQEVKPEPEQQIETRDFAAAVEEPAEAPARRRRPTARQRGTVARGGRASNETPTRAPPAVAPAARPNRPFVFQSGLDDVFGISIPQQTAHVDSDDDMADENQENDETSPVKARTPIATPPKRPQGAPVPLGELSIDDSVDTSGEIESEYPPSPKKSPVKQRRQGPSEASENMFHVPKDTADAGESSRTAAMRPPAITPPKQATAAEGSNPFTCDPRTVSPKKNHQKARTPAKPAARQGGLFGSTLKRSVGDGGITKKKTPSPQDLKKLEQKKKEVLEKKLWKLCGEDIRRWNRGDFQGYFPMKAARW